MRERSRKVWVWDPNPFNPYGAEVARVIAGSGYDVRVTSRGRASSGRGGGGAHPSLTRWHILPDAAGGEYSVSHAVRYAWAISRFFLAAVFTRATVVVAWANTDPERIAILFSRWMGVRVVIILHNPVPGREQVPPRSLRQLMRNAATERVVHTAELAKLVPKGAQVAAHPAYFGWLNEVRHSSARVRLGRPSPEQSIIALFLGALRDDKGINHLPDLDVRLHDAGSQLALCVGRADANGLALLDACEYAWKIINV